GARMPTAVACSSCGKSLRVPDNLLGKRVKCPGCGTAFTAGDGAGSGPPPAPEERVEERPSSRRPPPPLDDLDEVPGEEGARREGRGEEADEAARRRRRAGGDGEEARPSRRIAGGGAPHRGGLVLTLGIISLATFLLSLIAGVVVNCIGAATAGL